VPKQFADLEQDIRAAGLKILRRETLRVPVRFEGPDDAFRFGIDEGWAANILDTPGVPLAVARRIAKWGVCQAEYPFAFTHVIEMLEVGVSQSDVASRGASRKMTGQKELERKTQTHAWQCAESESGGR